MKAHALVVRSLTILWHATSECRLMGGAARSAAAALAIVALFALVSPTRVAEANRFGTPWLGAVVIDGAMAFAGPALDAPEVGPLGKGAILPVFAVVDGGPGPDGQRTWYRTPVGYLPSAAMLEQNEPWIADVVAENVPVFNKPSSGSGVRRTMHKGEVLRVFGMSPGVDGDPSVFWSTHEGWVTMNPGWPATPSLWFHYGPYRETWTIPLAHEAPLGRWFRITTSANVRAAPTTEAPEVGRLPTGTLVKVLSEHEGQEVLGTPWWYRIDGGRYAGAYVHSTLAQESGQPAPRVGQPSIGSPNGLWITIDRWRNVLTVSQGWQPIFSTYVSLGNAGTSTPPGTYATFGKFRYDDMTSSSVPNPEHTYDIPNVPDTQYFRDGGYAIHGTYWHDDFGTVHSLGCVNLTMGDAAYLFTLTSPPVPDSENIRWSSQGGATPVLIVGG